LRGLLLPSAHRLGPYEIVAPLGAGGMGEVYRARDTRLDRDVAVKILPRPFAQDPQRVARFEREARAVAALAHPSILVLHDVGTEGDVRYVVTELLEGQTLRERLQRAPLEWRKAVELVADVADGLAAAHGKDIVHRDLKPENIFLTADGRPKILDFGLARVAGTAERGADATLTQYGMVLGTVGYMAPEQVCGEAADARADIFALGIVLYEAIAGRQPFARTSLAETQLAVLHEEPPAFAASDRPAPAALERLIRRCLEKKREGRFQTASDLAFALRGLMADTEGAAQRLVTVRRPRPALVAGLVLGLLLVIGSIGFFSRDTTKGPDRSAAALPARTIASIAVLPLINGSRDPQAQLLGAGVPRAIIRTLLELPNLVVRPFSSVAHYAEAERLDAHEVGRQLDVEAVLAGTIAPHEQPPVITVELVDVRHNRSLWLQSYDLRQDPLFIQDDILKELAAKLDSQLSAAQRERLSRRPTQDTAAYLEYLDGLHAIQQWTVADVTRGIDRLERALARDPDFALAHASLADAYIAAAYIFMQPRVAFERARKAGVEALRCDPLLAEAHAAIATVLFHLDWDWTSARKGFEEALRLNPRCGFAYDYYGWYWIARGRADEAIAALEKAVDLEPRSVLYNADLAFVYQHGRRFDAAEVQARRTLAIDPNSSMAPWALALVHAHRDRDYAAARAQAEIFLERDRQRPDGYAMLGWVHGMSGRLDEARQMLEGLDRLADVYVRGEARAWIYTGMGDKDEAFRHLNQVCDERSPGIVYLKLDPLFDRLRDDPRFATLLQRIGVAD
jgi:serine/threonine-protein kinase